MGFKEGPPPNIGLTVTERKEIWKASEQDIYTSQGYSFFYPEINFNKSNFIVAAQQPKWFGATITLDEEIFDSLQACKIYPFLVLKNDMQELAEYVKQFSHEYEICADYVTALWSEKKEVLKVAVGRTFLKRYMEKECHGEIIFPQSRCDTWVEIKSCQDWPLYGGADSSIAVPDAIVDMVNEFFGYDFLSHLDEFLGYAVRYFGANLQEACFEGGDDGGEGGSGGASLPLLKAMPKNDDAIEP